MLAPRLIFPSRVLSEAATGLSLFSLTFGGMYDDSLRVNKWQSGNDYSGSGVDFISCGVEIRRAVIWEEIGLLDKNEIIR